MSQQVINIGAAPNDGSGDQLRASFNKCNDNFTELYAKGATEGLWNYNKTSTDTSTTPVSGRFKTNSGNYRDATQIAIHAITVQGIDRTSTLRALLVGDVVQCQDSTNTAAWCRFALQSLPVDHGAWFQLNVTFQTDGGVTSGDNQEIVFVFTAGGGSGVGAPVGAEYITSTTDATLTNERVLTDSATITWDRTTAGQIKAGTAAGVGNVSNSGTPTAGQYGKWVTATTIQGVAGATVLSDIGAAPLASPTFTGDPKAPTATAGDNDTSIATTAFVTAAIAASGSGTTTLGPPQGRLTLLTATPVMTTTQSAKTTIYYTPYCGNLIGLYNGTSVVMTTFSELSVATTDTTKSPAAIGASKVNDWFVWNDAGTIRIGHGPDWTSDTARSAGTALVMVNGILLNNAAITNGPAASRGTYVGTTRSNASSQLNWQLPSAAAGGGAGILGIWNTYNRVMSGGVCTDTTASWLSNVGPRMKNGSANNSIAFVTGLQEDLVVANSKHGLTTNYSDGSKQYFAIGVDTTSTFTSVAGQSSDGASYSSDPPMIGHSATSLGYHTWNALEGLATGANAPTTFGALTGPPARNSSMLMLWLPM